MQTNYKHLTAKVRTCSLPNPHPSTDEFQVTTRFLNFTGMSVDVASPLGFTLTIESDGYDKTYEDHFVVITSIRVGAKQIEQLRVFLNRYAINGSEIIDAIRA